MDKYIKKILIFSTIIMFLTGKGCLAAIDTSDLDSSISNEKSKFGINSFLSDSQKYVNDEDFDISDIFTNALKGKFDNNKILKYCLNLFWRKFQESYNINSWNCNSCYNYCYFEVNFRESWK